MCVLWHNEACANQRDNSCDKRPGACARYPRRGYFQMPLQISGEGQHEQSGERHSASGKPMMIWIVARREQVGNDAVTPVVIVREQSRAPRSVSRERALSFFLIASC